MCLLTCAVLSGFILIVSQVHGVPPPVCLYTVTNGGDYRGNVTVTESGLPCQRWDAQAPHSHSYTSQAYPQGGLEENFCRNPDGRNRPWCFTTDPSVPFEYCNITLCEFQFHQYNGYFYKYVTTSMAATPANEFCQADSGGTLASVHSAAENDFIWSIAGPAGGWIGLIVINRREDRWQDGTPIDYTNWFPGEPKYGATACTSLWSNKNALWDDRLCSARSAFVCKTEVDKCASGIVRCPAGYFCENYPSEFSCYCTFGYYREDNSCEAYHSCPEGWEQLEASCFKKFNQTKGYTDAQRLCSHEGARLAAVSNSSTYRFVSNFKNAVDNGTDFWIGLKYDSNIGAFVTSDGVTIANEPDWGLWAQDLWNETSGCGYLSPGDENNITAVNVSSCDVERPYLCEIVLTVADDCDPFPCNHAVRCEDRWADFICHCEDGWTGELCDTDIDECLSAPCAHDAPCSNHLGGFHCDCPAGYTGPICTDDINECASSPCQNDGLCVDMTDLYTCTCTDDYMGGRCQTSTRGTAGWVIALSVILPVIIIALLAVIITAALKRRKRRKGVSPAASRGTVSGEGTNSSNGVVNKGADED